MVDSTPFCWVSKSSSLVSVTCRFASLFSAIELNCPGVIQILQGLLSGLSGLLSSLGAGLLAGQYSFIHGACAPANKLADP